MAFYVPIKKRNGHGHTDRQARYCLRQLLASTGSLFEVSVMKSASLMEITATIADSNGPIVPVPQETPRRPTQRSSAA